MTLGHELRTLDAMDKSRLLMTQKNLGHELKALNDINDLRLWIPRTSQGYGSHE